ncbi:hypothetical protein HMPREF3218_0201118 [Prevotella bivia]|uniref:Uncharacterized protein n=1 Tax=Prevotella bivia TaxID=28125 RepID=A0A137SRP2_9BACT|nr:hypothetical protein HMPREF3202_02055 [Prevotella bivia]KXU58215.1 hypothetical protein HMPREF3218_0201118 [Prevotella bivia]
MKIFYIVDNVGSNNPPRKVGQKLGQTWVKKWVKTKRFKNTRTLNPWNSGRILFYKARNSCQKVGQKWGKE